MFCAKVMPNRADCSGCGDAIDDSLTRSRRLIHSITWMTLCLGSINLVDEGFWDATAVFDWWRKSARERGVEYIAERGGIAMTRNASGTRVESVTLKSGEVIACGQVLECLWSARNRARHRMAGVTCSG